MDASYYSSNHFLQIHVNSFHDTDNVRYDCWPLGATEDDATIDCGGEEIELTACHLVWGFM